MVVKVSAHSWILTALWFIDASGKLTETYIVCDERGVQVASATSKMQAVESALRFAAMENRGDVKVVERENRCSTDVPVQEILDYLELEQKAWDGVNADRYWQTTRILGFVQGLGLRGAVREWLDRDPAMQEFFHGKQEKLEQ